MSKNKFPAKDGWLTMTLTMTDKTPVAASELKLFASCGKPDDYEFGVCEQYGAQVKMVFRKKPNAPHEARQSRRLNADVGGES